ncbi:MAG: hypothetical protein H6608_12415 [Flavobacteriales bacterium]|nr:hypothetical protein [Bacteroidota bacterium]MCB9241935.1 hypothetical protein [Flavobacteriales bacterium]
MKNSILLFAVICTLSSCDSLEYRCATCQVEITELTEAFVLTSYDERSITDLNYTEPLKAVIQLSEQASKGDIPLEHLAFSEKDRMYCSVRCAQVVATKHNDKIEKLRAGLRYDDSLIRGLIPLERPTSDDND